MDYFNIFTDWLSHIQLNEPEWLWLIPFFISVNIIVFLFGDKYFIKSSPANLAKVSDKKQLLHPLIATLSKKQKAKPLKYFFRFPYLITFVLISFALSQPVKIGKKLPNPPQERDITFIVDTSVSMILRDYVLDGQRIDRMSLLKGVLDSFITQLKGERMSIIVFGDNAYTLVPLTTDQFLLRRMLSRVQATMAGRFNAMGDAIALAVIQATKNNINKKSKRKKILVLLTDADQPTGEVDPVIAAKLAKKHQLPLYTIAIGATTFAAQEQRQGGLLYSPVNLSLLQKISKTTGTKSYQAGTPHALDKAIQAIRLHETNRRKIEPYFIKEPLYFWLLILAAITFTSRQLIKITISNKEMVTK